MTVIWPGNDEEKSEVLVAIGHHCECVYDSETNEKTSSCPSHLALVNDQKFVDGLVFYRRISECLKREEDSRMRFTTRLN